MMKPFHPIILVFVLLFALVASAPNATAQSGGAYELTWSTIDGGGYMFSAGGGYELGGTIGQAEASAALSGGTYTLTGGFWSESWSRLFLPLIVR